MDVFMAPAGAAPPTLADLTGDTPWTKVGIADPDSLSWTYCDRGVCAAEDGHDGTCDEASGWDDAFPTAAPSGSFTATFQLAPNTQRAMFGPPDGIRVYTSESVPPGQVFMVAGEYAPGGQPAVMAHNADYREFTEAEYAGIVARRIVRQGFADTYTDFEEWEGPVGPAPDAPLPKAFRLLGMVMVREDWLFGSTARIVNVKAGEAL